MTKRVAKIVKSLEPWRIAEEAASLYEELTEHEQRLFIKVRRGEYASIETEWVLPIPRTSYDDRPDLQNPEWWAEHSAVVEALREQMETYARMTGRVREEETDWQERMGWVRRFASARD